MTDHVLLPLSNETRVLAVVSRQPLPEMVEIERTGGNTDFRATLDGCIEIQSVYILSIRNPHPIKLNSTFKQDSSHNGRLSDDDLIWLSPIVAEYQHVRHTWRSDTIQGRLTQIVLSLLVRIPVSKQIKQVGVAAERGDMERRVTDIVGRIDVGAMIQKTSGHFDHIFPTGLMQSRRAYFRLHLRIDARCQQQFDHIAVGYS